MNYLDFELEIGQGSGREYPVALVRSPAGEARATIRFPFDELELENHLQKLEIALLRSGGKRRRVLLPEEQTVQSFGQHLFDVLLAGEVRSRYDVSQSEARQQDKGLRLKLRIQSPELAALPWEFLYDSRQGEYVCLSRDTPLIRYLELPQVIRPLSVTPPLRILAMISSPHDLEPLNLDREKQRVEEATKSLRAQGLLEFTWLEGQTWRDLQRAMRGGPWHGFHFIGHGGFDRNAEEGLIALATEQGETYRLFATELARLLADHRSLRLAVLNSCEGARGGKRDIFSSTAAIMVRRGIPAVLAMQYEITDRAAIEFARSFYEAVAEGMPVDAAVAEARKSISLAVTNTLEWGTPVLYMRSPDGVLFSLSEKPSAKEVPPPVRHPEEVAAAPSAVPSIEQPERERLEREDLERAAREEAERRAREEAAQRERGERERAAREEAERRAREEAARLEQERREREEREQAAKEEAERKAREEAAQQERERQERLAREQAERQEEARRASEKAEAEQLEQERRERQEREKAARAEAERKAREEEARLQQQRQARERAEAERLARQEAAEEALARERVEAERKAKERAAQPAVQPTPWKEAPTPVGRPGVPAERKLRGRRVVLASIFIVGAIVAGLYNLRREPDLSPEEWYFTGLFQGIAGNHAEAVKSFRKAAEQGHAGAQASLGGHYLSGQGVPQNDAEAVKWLRKAAEQGDGLAQVSLGWMYEGGRGVEQDDAEAVKWYRKAADQADPRGQFALGVRYAEGQGVPQNDAEAVKSFRKAAEQGHAGAQNNLGVMYQEGRGVPQNDDEAVKWLRKAAEQGYADTQNNLGVIYEQGRGVPRDDAEAVK